VSNLVEHARRELDAAGLFDKDSDYNGMLGEAVIELVKVFADQDHSGMSATMTRQLFDELVQFNNLTPLSNNPYEWTEVADSLWQSKRRASVFSHDGGMTWYDLYDESLNNGDHWDNHKRKYA
jgi:hypothetical protein